MDLFTDNRDFYPTPTEVIDKMMIGEEIAGKTFLEPSAGSGNIVNYLKKNGAKEVFACENDPYLQRLLRGKCTIIGDDFLKVTSDMISSIDHIVMNPPFSDAANHIMHAYNIAPPGCTVTALCNSSSLDGGYSKEWRILKEAIQLYGHSEYIGQCFANSERDTNVGVSLIKLYKQGETDNEFDGYMFSEQDDDSLNGNVHEGLVPYNVIRDMVNRYIESVKMFDNTLAMANKINDTAKIDNECYLPIRFEAVNSSGNVYRTITHDFYKKELQKYYWRVIFKKLNMQKYATQKLSEQINTFVEEQSNIPFTMHNIYKMLEIVVKTTGNRMQSALVEAFDLICSFSSENSTAGETWKTNANYMVNKKFIIPCMTRYDDYGIKNQFVELEYGGYVNRIEDICKALCFITGDRYEDIGELRNYVRGSHIVWGIWYEWGFFKFKAFKKGTMHFIFKDDDVWFKFNYEVSKTKGWALPKKSQKGGEK